jgi:hypothetical protein
MVFVFGFDVAQYSPLAEHVVLIEGGGSGLSAEATRATTIVTNITSDRKGIPISPS